MAKNLLAMQETWVQSLGWEKSPLKGNRSPLQYSGLERSQGQKTLAGYSPWGRKESDKTEQLSLSVWLIRTADRMAYSESSLDAERCTVSTNDPLRRFPASTSLDGCVKNTQP